VEKHLLWKVISIKARLMVRPHKLNLKLATMKV